MAEIRIDWDGKTWIIPETKAFQIGERVEEIAPLGEILSWMKAPRFFRMARCLGEMLRFAGCKVSDAEVHQQLVSSLGGAEGTGYAGAVFALVDLLMGDAPRAGSGDGASPGKSDPS